MMPAVVGELFIPASQRPEAVGASLGRLKMVTFHRRKFPCWYPVLFKAVSGIMAGGN